jgi:hypothetical protein
VLRLKDDKPTSETPEPALHLLDAATGKTVRPFTGDPGEVEWVQFQPDGTTALTYARYHNIPNGQRRETGVRVWDVATGKEVRQVPAASDCVALSGDSRKLAAGLQLTEFEAGRPLGALTSPQAMTYALAVSRSGRLVAASLHNYAIRAPELHVWEAASRKPIHVWPRDKLPVVMIAFSPDERLLAAGGADTVVRIYDLETGAERKTFRGHRGFVAALAFSPDGRRLVSGGADAVALVWDVYGLAVEAAAPTPAELAALWNDLLSSDPHVSEPAVQRLARAPAQSVPFLREQLKAPSEVDAKAIARWIEELEAADFKTRTKAEQELARVGTLAEPALRTAAQNPKSAEQRKRLKGLLARFDADGVSLPVLRLIRCVAVLERAATPEAHELLKALAGDKADPRVASEARATLERSRKPGVP